MLATILISEFVLGQAAQPKTPVSPEEVWQAVIGTLEKSGARPDRLPRQNDLEVPVIPMATVPRHLRVAGGCWEESRARMMLRLECEIGTCNPFIAYLRAEKEVLAAPGTSLSDCRIHPKSNRSPEPAQAVVQPGQRATVLFAGSGLRVSTEVTCLEHGVEGEMIRVRNRDGGVFRARVSGPGTLQAVAQ
jgi:hypothetical protein